MVKDKYCVDQHCSHSYTFLLVMGSCAKPECKFDAPKFSIITLFTGVFLYLIKVKAVLFVVISATSYYRFLVSKS